MLFLQIHCKKYTKYAGNYGNINILSAGNTHHTFCLTLSCLDIIQNPQEHQTCPIVRRMLHRLPTGGESEGVVGRL